jgi:hypothetical protein
MHVLLGSSGVVKRVLTIENALENANVHICWDTMVLAHGSKGVEVELEKMKKISGPWLVVLRTIGSES